VTADAPDHYCLTVAYSPKLKKGFPVAWVRIGKGYVGYHFMPVYMFPSLRAGLSKKLKARMQGKSCFNFNKVDEPLIGELESLVRTGYDRTAGNSEWGAAQRVEHGMAHRKAGEKFEAATPG
jgi:hypothetical protein